MFRLRTSRFLLAVEFAINWIGVLARNCGSNEFLDPFTGNCDPCGPVCAAGDCSSVCPNYVISTSPSNTSTTVTSSDSGLNTSQLLLVVLLPILLGLVLVLTVVTMYKTFCRQKKICCSMIVYENAIQESEKDSKSEAIALNREIEMYEL